MVPVRLFTSACIAFTTLMLASPANAWEVCNETSFILRVATAATVDGTLTPKGWTRARPGQCLTFTSDYETPRYVYAQSSLAHAGGIREWAGQHSFCAGDTDFEADIEISCALQGLETRSFLAIDPTDQNTTFVEPADYGSKAQVAGLQRLLSDNGYSVPSIDGLSGRQTTRNLSSFLKDKGLTSGLSKVDQIDALESSALERSSDVGITVCNKAESLMWTAVAYRLGASWESRGWWPVEGQTCLRPHTSSIKNADAHIFALLETSTVTEQGVSTAGEDLALKSNTAVPQQFCVAESRFAATGRDNCTNRGYNAVAFRPLANDVDGVTVNLSASDFSERSATGLRQ